MTTIWVFWKPSNETPGGWFQAKLHRDGDYVYTHRWIKHGTKSVKTDSPDEGVTHEGELTEIENINNAKTSDFVTHNPFRPKPTKKTKPRKKTTKALVEKYRRQMTVLGRGHVCPQCGEKSVLGYLVYLVRSSGRYANDRRHLPELRGGLAEGDEDGWLTAYGGSAVLCGFVSTSNFPVEACGNCWRVIIERERAGEKVFMTTAERKNKELEKLHRQDKEKEKKESFEKIRTDLMKEHHNIPLPTKQEFQRLPFAPTIKKLAQYLTSGDYVDFPGQITNVSDDQDKITFTIMPPLDYDPGEMREIGDIISDYLEDDFSRLFKNYYGLEYSYTPKWEHPSPDHPEGLEWYVMTIKYP
jgi:hypothetical protein